MKTQHATQIRRGITLARAGQDLTFRDEEPATIDAYLRTSSATKETR